MKKIMLLVVLSFLILSNACTAMIPDSGPIRQPRTGIFDNEGAFVNIPATAGKIIFTFAGLSVAIPAEFTGDLLCLTPQTPKYSLPLCFKTFGRVGEGIFGLPSYCLKKTFYDAPLYLWDTITKKDFSQKDNGEKKRKETNGRLSVYLL